MNRRNSGSIEILERRIENQRIRNSMKYKNNVHRLGKIRFDLKDSERVWVYLQSFNNDDILDGKFIFNYGVMDDEMKDAIGMVLDYGSYKQTIVEMDFGTFKNFYEENRLKIELLDEKYPGIAI